MSDLDERPSKIRKITKTHHDDEDTSEIKRNSEAEQTDEENGTTFGSFPLPEPSSEGNADQVPALSKSQMKKLAKRQAWEAGKEYRKVKRREKHKEKQARKAEDRANGVIREEPEVVNVGGEKKSRPRRPVQTPVGLILDCDFENLMSEKERISLGAQVTRCYSENRSSPYRAHLAISSFDGSLKERFETVLQNYHKSWKGVKFYQEDFVEAAAKLDVVMKGPGGGKLMGAFAPKDDDVKPTKPAEGEAKSLGTSRITQPTDGDNGTSNACDTTMEGLGHAASVAEPAVPDDTQASDPTQTTTTTEADDALEEANGPQIVYLSSDSVETLSVLEPNTSYIIGGIVDKNRYKGLCYKRACERGIRTAKLPISEYMTMQSRSVLTINHVVEIMLRWLETGDWGESFMRVIPKRKEAKLKVKKGDKGDEEDSYDEDEAATPLAKSASGLPKDEPQIDPVTKDTGLPKTVQESVAES